jgi:predicted nucleic acid-binding protein
MSEVAELNAPNLIMQEVANALWRATKLKKISLRDAKEALRALNDLRIKLYQSDWIQTSEELSLAYRLNLTIYDIAYIALAERMKVPLITADQKLYETAKKNFRITHIKEYP